MSDPRKLAAKLTDRPIDYAGVPGGASGLGLTGLDIAGAMGIGKASPTEMRLVYLKWVQDKSVMPALMYDLLLITAKVAADEKWRIPKGEGFLRKLVRMAVLEVCDPMICPTCNGRGRAMIGHKEIICDACNSAGRKGWTDGMRARVVGCAKSSWSETWGKRYAGILAEVERIEMGGLYAIVNGMYEAEE